MSAMRRLAGLLLCALVVQNCKSRGDEETEEVSSAPRTDELKPLDLRDDTPNLLLTWIDDKGDFHVVQKPADVPKEHRQAVRVVVTNREEGTGKFVYVADLSKTNPNGSYPVRSMSRANWDEMGAGRRKARLEALAPSAAPPASNSAASAKGEKPPAQKPAAGRVVAIVYGAEWCKPCHDAARYLKQRGVTVIEKDIETSELFATEMKKKLERAGMPASSSIPIIDVMGQLMVGFSPRALEHAIETAQNAKPL